jgi:hydrocephalus-inducing protein
MPADGFLAPGQDVKLEVTFHPTAVNADIRVERIHCRLLNSAGSSAADAAGGAAASSDLLLTLTGACVQSEAAGELTFKCNVRTSTSKSITLSNSSSTNWQLRPAIQNEFWSGPEFLQVRSQLLACVPAATLPMPICRTVWSQQLPLNSNEPLAVYARHAAMMLT